MTGVVDYRTPHRPKPDELVTLDGAHIIPHNLAQPTSATDVSFLSLRFLTVGGIQKKNVDSFRMFCRK
jgi:hypothetical protein